MECFALVADQKSKDPQPILISVFSIGCWIDLRIGQKALIGSRGGASGTLAAERNG
jgi:hypothetical protein